MPVIVAAGARLGIIDSLRYRSGQLFMAAWVEGRVAGKRHWTQSLFSLQVDAPEVTFNAGQFGRLALPAPPGEKEPMLGRPYSFVNPPQRQPHEFYFIVLPGGPLTPRLAALECRRSRLARSPRQRLLLDQRSGRGRRAVVPVDRHRHRPVPVHAAHRRTLGEIRPRRAGACGAQCGGTDLSATRSPKSAARTRARSRSSRSSAGKRIRPRSRGAFRRPLPTAGWRRGPGIALSPANSHAMLCGNPAMVEDTQKLLETRGMRRHRRKEPGHVTVETYW